MIELVGEVSRLAGLARPSSLRVPYPVAAGLALTLDRIAAWRGRSFRITAERVRKFCANTQYSSARARALAFEPRVPVTEGLARLVRAETARR
jgi:nucleoside-diphosphate-sugar epimerase